MFLYGYFIGICTLRCTHWTSCYQRRQRHGYELPYRVRHRPILILVIRARCRGYMGTHTLIPFHISVLTHSYILSLKYHGWIICIYTHTHILVRKYNCTDIQAHTCTYTIQQETCSVKWHGISNSSDWGISACLLARWCV